MGLKSARATLAQAQVSNMGMSLDFIGFSVGSVGLILGSRTCCSLQSPSSGRFWQRNFSHIFQPFTQGEARRSFAEVAVDRPSEEGSRRHCLNAAFFQMFARLDRLRVNRGHVHTSANGSKVKSTCLKIKQVRLLSTTAASAAGTSG
jgi:hypothetical protein